MANPWAGYKALVNLASGSTSSADLVLTDAGDHQNFTVPLASAQRYIDRATAVVVQTTLDGVSWTTQSTSNYTLRYLTAKVTLNSALTGGTAYGCRLHSFNYYPYASIALAYDITFNGARLMLDVTALQGSSGTGWLSYIPGLLGGKFASKNWMLASGATIYAAHLVANDLLILSFVAPNGTNAFESYCYISDTNWQEAVNGIAMEDLNFQCDSVIALI